MATPSRRKRHVPDAAPHELVGAQLFVPAEVFPKEEPPRGKDGWKAVVTGYNKANHDEIFVKFPGFGSEQYFFPRASVEEWRVHPSAQQQQKQPSKAGARAATGPSPAVPPPSPAKSTAARRSSVQPRASQAGDTAGPSGEGGSQDQGQQQQQQQPAAAAGGESPRARGRPRRRSAAGSAAKAAAPPEEEDEIQEEPEQPSSEEGSEQMVGGSSEEEEEEGGRAPKRRRTQGAAVPAVTVRDVVNFCAGSVMTYVMLRFMYPAEP